MIKGGKNREREKEIEGKEINKNRERENFMMKFWTNL